MRRRTTCLVLFLSAIVGVLLFWRPQREKKRAERYTPRLRKFVPEIPKNIVIPPKPAYGTVPTGWRPFRPPDSFLAESFVVESTVSQGLPCADDWVAQGTVCEVTAHTGVDALWTWINGSEPILAGTRDQVVAAAMQGPRPPPFLGSRTTHFRTHGEMVNSMRSVLHSMLPGLVQKYIILTADVAADDTDELRLGSVPTWLDVDAGVRLLHHSDVFRVPQTSLAPNTTARSWRDRIVPSFNSLAIESQIAHIPDLAPTIFYLNDDCFLLKPLSAGDFETPLYGPVFRIQFDLGVRSRSPGSLPMGRVDKEGEWPGLQYTNWLLDQRFGKRERRYLHHVAKVLPTPIMREAAAVWADEIAQTAESRFRGQGPQVNLVYLTTWYTIEKHRESLLYSFIMLRADADADGVFSPAEHRALTDGLQATIPVALREGGSAYYVANNLGRARVVEPRETSYEWLASDGYPLIKLIQTSDSYPERGYKYQSKKKTSPAEGHCAMDVGRCFAGGSVLEVFRRVAFEMPECGDCLIAHLVGRSGPQGLSAFLPPKSASAREPPRQGPPLAKRWQDAEFASGVGRGVAVDLIQRYTYVVGSSPMQFMELRRRGDTRLLPNETSPVAFLAVNDDIRDDDTLAQMDVVIRKWYALRWGNIRGWWERR
ncbi:hypothetical protein C8R43DRAFT_1024938 [Mycena crocata]|nr:hypothetical protein C8R43DRAFT_1024938 [Mycena crocata]